MEFSQARMLLNFWKKFWIFDRNGGIEKVYLLDKIGEFGFVRLLKVLIQTARHFYYFPNLWECYSNGI